MKRKTTTDVMQNTNTRQDESKDMKHGLKERKERENYYQRDANQLQGDEKVATNDGKIVCGCLRLVTLSRSLLLHK